MMAFSSGRTFFGCLTICVVGCCGQDIFGFPTDLSQSVLDYALQFGLDVLSASLSSLPLPDISGSKDIGLSHVTYGASGMSISNFEAPGGSISVQPDGSLLFTFTGGSITVHGEWSYAVKTLFTVRDQGIFDVTATGINVTLPLSLDLTSPSTSCSGSMPSVEVTFQGGASWFYNLFTWAIMKPIQAKIKGGFCEEAKSAIDSVSGYLSTLTGGFGWDLSATSETLSTPSGDLSATTASSSIIDDLLNFDFSFRQVRNLELGHVRRLSRVKRKNHK